MAKYRIYKCKQCHSWHEYVEGARSRVFIPFRTQQAALTYVRGLLKGREYFP